ncbi:alpha/beta hydrolase [Desulfofustis limnaeus]|jgi:pimeloyl-ACP methyl ester carboxylesterase|uniref:Alpha/beta hydrolase n=1 Tax=Desulfofustis limnaeus TaxID=2740163 RepID=A0ABM7WAF5_9BACT|nr:alpha/beta hydrolase [Desulfofustis limnaeus]
MPFLSSDAVRLYYEEVGSGETLIFAHEFGGDVRSWEAQMRFFGRYFRCIAFNARGYPPSDVPQQPSAYRQEIASVDLLHVLDELQIDRAHIVGLSMGSVTTLDFALRYPSRARSITVCGCGYGSIAAERKAWLESNEVMADSLVIDLPQTVRAYANGPTRLPYRRKDPRGWQAFIDQMATLDPTGASLTLRGIQAKRPSLYDFADRLRVLAVPTLIVVGDEDQPALEPSLFLKRVIPDAALWVLPRTGHAVNTEEPALFNRALLDFLFSVKN